jgi:hypothetical protein
MGPCHHCDVITSAMNNRSFSICFRCVPQDVIHDLLGISPGTSPPASNASPTVSQSKAIDMWKTSPPPTSDKKELALAKPTPLVASASFGSERLLLRLGSSGSVPPALQPRSERARRIQNIVQCARMNSPHRPGECNPPSPPPHSSSPLPPMQMVYLSEVTCQIVCLKPNYVLIALLYFVLQS